MLYMRLASLKKLFLSIYVVILDIRRVFPLTSPRATVSNRDTVSIVITLTRIAFLVSEIGSALSHKAYLFLEK